MSCYSSDKKSGTLVLICELMDMNIYELIRGEWYPIGVIAYVAVFDQMNSHHIQILHARADR